MRGNGKQGNKMGLANRNGLESRAIKDRLNASMLANIRMVKRKGSASTEMKNRVLYSKGSGIMEM